MTRTPTLPYDDRSMWRRLVSRSHPDAGGDHELFIWTVATRDAICGGELGSEIPRRERRETPWSSAGECIPFDQFADFEVLTDRAVTMAEAVAEPFAYLLRQVADCYRLLKARSMTNSAAAPLIGRSPLSATRSV
jgi:hypothetical protein